MFAIEYIGINGQMISMEGLPKRWVRDEGREVSERYKVDMYKGIDRCKCAVVEALNCKASSKLPT